MAAVIGANFGDEGKGLVTDYLSQDPGTLVVRYNGGAQAGHTVVTPDGRRHVFHHVGSGAFNGAATFLSRFFVVNPMFLGDELRELARVAVRPFIYVDPRAAVTTPFDIMLNQAVEKLRGDARHGSCGFGINETVTRNESPEFALVVADLFDRRRLRTRLKDIRERYVPMRASELGVPIEGTPYLYNANIFDAYLDDCEAFINSWAELREWNRDFVHGGPIVFEGAQGLLLDQDHPNFPHVTRSKTGIANVATLLEEAGIRDERLEVYYVTRTYLTRHGAGPLTNPLAGPPTELVVDETNVPNPHQGALRFGTLDLDELVQEIKRDFEPFLFRLPPFEINLAMTCADQWFDGRMTCIFGGELRTLPVEYVSGYLMGILASARTLISYGPTREMVRVFGDVEAAV